MCLVVVIVFGDIISHIVQCRHLAIDIVSSAEIKTVCLYELLGSFASTICSLKRLDFIPLFLFLLFIFVTCLARGTEPHNKITK